MKKINVYVLIVLMSFCLVGCRKSPEVVSWTKLVSPEVQVTVGTNIQFYDPLLDIVCLKIQEPDGTVRVWDSRKGDQFQVWRMNKEFVSFTYKHGSIEHRGPFTAEYDYGSRRNYN